jgi:hypothetical protein
MFICTIYEYPIMMNLLFRSHVQQISQGYHDSKICHATEIIKFRRQTELCVSNKKER